MRPVTKMIVTVGNRAACGCACPPPCERSCTITSRCECSPSLLPARVPFADAVHAAGRAALAVVAFSGRPDLLLAATEDRFNKLVAQLQREREADPHA